ncbi:peptidase M20 [Hymenobacter sedentarius]|uniref:Peptidase M20 n=1 Tax=Hymenobacter sedentarius TaxID=1411621 RepID=A0A0U4C3R5_9BACT|nr:M20/M25/M40 family metallo-hydrolase [Hymenobacter sedentarius]ALW84824.1 peptidase M20 [Hymenobacter sedentarius]
MKKLYALALLALLGTGQATDPLLKVRQFRRAHEQELLREFEQLVAIPNVAADTANLRHTALFIQDMMRRRGIKTQLLAAPAAGVPPVVFGEVRTPGATRTIIFYAHYDGQPVNPAQWREGLAPFQPTYATGPLDRDGKITPRPAPGQPVSPDWRLYARSASDDKAGVMTILAGYQALAASKLKPKVNIKFFFEGEEERGSPHLAEILSRYKALLASDLWVICDGPVHQSGRKQVVFGARGDVNMSLKVYGPRRPLHSGHYGNWAPNPALALARLLASMEDSTGRVRVAGFYDDVTPLTPAEKAALARVPNLDQTIRQELGFARPYGTGQSLVELLNQPSLNINGMQSANVGAQAANVIPTVATAVLDLRLVPGNDAQRQVQKVIRHIDARGYHVTAAEPTDAERAQYPLLVRVQPETGYNAQRTPLDLPMAQQVIKAVQTTTPSPVVVLPTMGGSLPLYVFEQQLNAHTITVPVANYDNNQHAENENIRLGNLWEGLETMAAIMLLK